MKPLQFKPPLDSNGNPYWVPIVIKNKDVLCSFINGMQSVMDVFELKNEDVNILLGSERFNDVLPNGKIVSQLTDQEIINYRNEIEENYSYSHTNIENIPDILNNYYLSAECTCGMFYGFNSEYDVPENDFECGVCGKKVIIYTGHSDGEYVYHGSTKIDLLTYTKDEQIKKFTISNKDDLAKLEEILGDKLMSAKDIKIKDDYDTTQQDNLENVIKAIEKSANTNSNMTENYKLLMELNDTLNRKANRMEILKNLLAMPGISKSRITELETEFKNIKEEIDNLIKRIDDLSI